MGIAPNCRNDWISDQRLNRPIVFIQQSVSVGLWRDPPRDLVHQILATKLIRCRFAPAKARRGINVSFGSSSRPDQTLPLFADFHQASCPRRDSAAICIAMVVLPVPAALLWVNLGQPVFPKPLNRFHGDITGLTKLDFSPVNGAQV